MCYYCAIIILAIKGDPLGPLLFCLVLHQVVCAIATNSECASLLFHRWYIDDGVVAGPISAVLRVLSIIKDLEPPLGLHINLSKYELFSVSRFLDEMKKNPNASFRYTWGSNRRFFCFVPIILLKSIQMLPNCSSS